MLSQDELAVCDVRKSDQEHVRARATGEPRGLCVEEKDVRPVAGCVALEAKVREEERIARSPSDDLEPEIVECDALLTHFECSRWRALLSGSPLLAAGYARLRVVSER